MPVRLIEDEDHFSIFKRGLEETIERFTSTPIVQTKSSVDETRQAKRRRVDTGSDYQGKYNPKYLTSRELFSLEVRDVCA